jgi:hypothetical protein
MQQNNSVFYMACAEMLQARLLEQQVCCDIAASIEPEDTVCDPSLVNDW